MSWLQRFHSSLLPGAKNSSLGLSFLLYVQIPSLHPGHDPSPRWHVRIYTGLDTWLYKTFNHNISEDITRVSQLWYIDFHWSSGVTNCTHTHTLAHTHAHICTHTHTHTCTHMYTSQDIPEYAQFSILGLLRVGSIARSHHNTTCCSSLC